MKKTTSIIFAVFCFIFFSSLMGGYAFSESDVRRITKEELKTLLNDPNTIIIDVRQGGDWQQGELKIKGAAREDPMADEESWAKKYPKGKNIVLYCA